MAQSSEVCTRIHEELDPGLTLRRMLGRSRWLSRAVPHSHRRSSRVAVDLEPLSAKLVDPAAIEQWREDFSRDGFVVITDLLSADQCESLVHEAHTLHRQGEFFLSTETHTPYQLEPDDELPDEHPRNHSVESEKTIVDYDRIPDQSYIKALYRNPIMLSCVQAIVGSPLYLSACPFNAGYYNIFNPGDQLGWHFDNSSFGVNLLLQQPPIGSGGDFQFHHKTRTEATYAYSQVGEILTNGEDANLADRVQVPDLRAGSLVIFNGRHSLHRVAPVKDGQRLNVIFTYETKTSTINDDYSLRKFFGRTAAEAEELQQKMALSMIK